MSVANTVLYDVPNKGLPGIRKRSVLQPTSGNATFSPTHQIEFLIPSSHSGQYLNCENTVLRFKCTVTGAAGKFDHNASCLIDRMEVFIGSQQVENIMQYSTLYSMLLDIQMDKLSHGGGVATSQGTKEWDGDAAYNTGEGLDFAAGDSTYIALPLMSSVCGILGTKMFPIGKLNSPIRVVLYLDTAANALIKTEDVNSPTFTLSEVYLDCDILELSQSAEAVATAANAAFGDNIQIAVKQYSHFLYTLPTGSSANSDVSKLVDARFSSINQLLFAFRDLTGNAEGYSKSSRVNPYSNFQIRIANQYFPPKRLEFPQGAGDISYNHEAYIETQKAFHALSSLSHWGAITRTTFNKRQVAYGNKAARNASHANKFFLCIDLEAYTNKSGLLFDGISTINDTIMVNGQIQGANLTLNVQCDVFVQHDTILSIDPTGTCTRSM